MPEVKAEARTNGYYGNLWTLIQVVGNVSGLVSLIIVAIWAGSLKKQVDINTGRLDKIEAGGSPTLRAAVDTLNFEIQARKESDAFIGKQMEDMRVNFNERCNHITSLLEKQVEQQTALISLIRAQQQVGK